MSDTITIGKNITIVSDGTPSNFDSTTYFPGGVYLSAVKIEGAAGDTIIIRDSSATGEILSRFVDAAGDGLKDSFIPPKFCKPYMAAADVTLTAGTIVILELA